MFFDSHTHVNFTAFKADKDAVIDRALSDSVWMVNVGTQLDTSKECVELAAKYDKGVYAAIGLHPIHTYQQMVDEEESHFKTREEVFDPKAYQELVNDKVVAVGECGLDYFRLPEQDVELAKQKQKESFRLQLAFAKENKLPVIVHCRDAYEDLAAILNTDYQNQPGVIHSFTDTWDTAKKFLDLGFYIALNGITTFDKTGKLAAVAKNTPPDKLLIETDAPYLTPPPFRGKRNEPAYVQYVAEHLGALLDKSKEQVGQQTFENAVKLFGITT